MCGVATTFCFSGPNKPTKSDEIMDVIRSRDAAFWTTVGGGSSSVAVFDSVGVVLGHELAIAVRHDQNVAFDRASCLQTDREEFVLAGPDQGPTRFLPSICDSIDSY